MLFTTSILLMIVGYVFVFIELKLVGSIVFTAALVLLATAIFQLWHKIIIPTHELIDELKNSSASAPQESQSEELIPDTQYLTDQMKELLSASTLSEHELRQKQELIEQFTDKLLESSHFGKHINAINEQHLFNPENVRNAFAQSSNAADYATQTFEKIYMSINSLGTAYTGIREESTTLRESANTSVDLSASTKTTIDHLATQATEISSVTQNITDIASMTQLLALNASIEAARAGESGRGFAVVADEVKKLAEQTDAAANKISQISHSISAASEQSATSMAEINERIEFVRTTILTVVETIDNQWSEVQVLLGQMGQAAGTVSGLKGILQASEQELESHFIMLEGIYQFAQHSAQATEELLSILNVTPPEVLSQDEADDAEITEDVIDDELLEKNVA